MKILDFIYSHINKNAQTEDLQYDNTTLIGYFDINDYDHRESTLSPIAIIQNNQIVNESFGMDIIYPFIKLHALESTPLKFIFYVNEYFIGLDEPFKTALYLHNAAKASYFISNQLDYYNDEIIQNCNYRIIDKYVMLRGYGEALQSILKTQLSILIKYARPRTTTVETMCQLNDRILHLDMLADN